MVVSILRPDYTSGTITLTAGSAAFTLTGGSLVTAAVENGDQILLPDKGYIVTIFSVTDSANGVLTDPCPAALAGAGQDYRIRFQPEGSRLAAWTRDMLDKLASGNVEALAGLVGAADKLPFFTGPGAMALADFSAASRAILAGGLGDAASKTVQTSATDTTAGRLMSVGAFGLGAQVVANEIDLNNYLQGGSYITPIGPLTNQPANWNNGRSIIFVGGGTSYVSQILINITTNEMAYRIGSTLSIGPWISVGVIGGSNSNGEYVRFPDGTQICTKLITGIGPINLAWGTIFQSANFSAGNFAANFIAKPLIGATSHQIGPGLNSIVSGSVEPTTSSWGSFALVRASAVTTTDYALALTAVGRWK